MSINYVFYVGSTPTQEREYPCFYLSRTQWDDYGFSTSFTLYYLEAIDKKNLIGSVKIAEIGQSSGRTVIPIKFTGLEPIHFSLGQSDKYYEKLKNLAPGIQSYVLKSLRDLTKSSDAMRIAENEKSYSFSLIRFLGPMAIAGLKRHDQDNHKFEFESHIHSSDIKTKCAFNFNKDEIIPCRINALIGRNGAGKTQLLANFVSGLLGLGEEKIDVTERESISKVIVVSYSIFDRFFLPDQIQIPANRSRREYISKDLKYIYIGLRERVASNEETKKSNTKDSTKIAGSAAFARRFTSALQKLKDENRYEIWKKAMRPILREADFLHEENISDSQLRLRFRRLGAGHKATLSMLTSLFSELVDESLVVIDEPENHLHPTLLSAMMHVLRDMLKMTNSFAVISTHSPIVIQEIPAKYVQVITKSDDYAQLTPLRKESFGTSIDTLTSEIFSLSYQMPNYGTVLKGLAKENISIEVIENKLGMSLSVEARSFYLSMMPK